MTRNELREDNMTYLDAYNDFAMREYGSDPVSCFDSYLVPLCYTTLYLDASDEEVEFQLCYDLSREMYRIYIGDGYKEREVYHEYTLIYEAMEDLVDGSFQGFYEWGIRCLRDIPGFEEVH